MSARQTSTKPKFIQERRITTAPPLPRPTPRGAFELSPIKHRPKLRVVQTNKNPTWSTRNRSNILPHRPPATERHIVGAGVSGGRATRVPPPARQWPWQERASRSEIFAGNPNPVDVNNNPNPSTARSRTRLGRGLVPRGERWPWQRRGQSSADIFNFDRAITETTPTAATITPTLPPASRKWPWQERAMQSLIFNQPEDPRAYHRTYTWDQRRTNPFFEGGGVMDESTRKTTTRSKKQSLYPWAAAARESLIFKPLPPKEGRHWFYPWDQGRDTWDDLLVDPNAKFEAVSRYNTEFVKKTPVSSSIRAAGKSCYEGEMGLRTGLMVRRQYQRYRKKGINAEAGQSKNNEKENWGSVDQPQRKETHTIFLHDTSNKKNVADTTSELEDQMAGMRIHQDNNNPAIMMSDS